MKTYAEAEGLGKFDWRIALQNAIEGNFYETAYDDELRQFEDGPEALTARANMWTTCACGNQCEVIPRDEKGRPIDFTLAEFGRAFWRRIRAGDYEDALVTLESIEKRSAELIALHHASCIPQG